MRKFLSSPTIRQVLSARTFRPAGVSLFSSGNLDAFDKIYKPIHRESLQVRGFCINLLLMTVVISDFVFLRIPKNSGDIRPKSI